MQQNEYSVWVLPAVRSRGGSLASGASVIGLVIEVMSSGKAAVMDFTCWTLEAALEPCSVLNLCLWTSEPFNLNYFTKTNMLKVELWFFFFLYLGKSDIQSRNICCCIYRWQEVHHGINCFHCWCHCLWTFGTGNVDITRDSTRETNQR